MRWLQAWLAAVPIALAAATLLYLGAAVAGANPFWHWEPLNLSEAAALRDAGEVSRLLESGADPNAAYDVRAGFLFTTARRLTPLEAARVADRPEIVDLLRAGGAR